MSYTINASKESATPRKPVLLAAFTFPDGSVWRAATIACTYGGNAYVAALSDQNIERLAFLSEQGIDRVPSVSVAIADPTAALYATWERGANKGFRGSTLVLRFLLLDLITDEQSSDSLIPFIGTCDQPVGPDEKGMTVTATNKLNLAPLQLPIVRVSVDCPWLNPKTTQQRTEAASGDSRFFPCGETRDLTTAPPCSQTRQTCTQPLRFGGSTWQTGKDGEGREYISGNKVTWTNPDTSGKLHQYWPQWLGGAAWVDLPVLNQWADGNYTRGEAAVGVGVIDVLRVIVNNVELDQSMSGDYRWHYVNHGARDGAHNTDTGYTDGDPYGNLTAIQFLAPHKTIDPNSLASVRILGRKATASANISVVSAAASGGLIRVEFGRVMGLTDPGDGTLVTITGNTWAAANGSFVLRYLDLPYDHAYLEGTNATGSGTGGTLYYASATLGSGGAVPTPWVIQEALKATGRFNNPSFGTTWAPAAALCEETISYTDQDGVVADQMRFSSTVALRDRRSVAEVVRGLRMSIGARLYLAQDGKLEIGIEGPLGEQQPSAVDGSNYNTAISSTLRDGTTVNGYAAYRFDESNCWDLKRTAAGSSSTTPNKVVFPFSDPANDWAISTFSNIDPEDVSRMDQENSGGLQVQPEGIASYNHAYRTSRLGLAKVLRGNSSGDTRGTDWWQWETSFRACKLQIGHLVLLTDARLGLSNQLVRITGMKPARNYETVTLTGHYHVDSWYADAPAALANPERSFYRFTFPGDVSAPPTFAVAASLIDSTVAEVSGLAFAADDDNKSIKSGVFEFFYCDPTAPQTTLSANLTIGAGTISLTSTSGLASGDYLQVGDEVLKIGTPGGTTPISRAQLGSSAAAATSGANVFKLLRSVVTVSLSDDFINSPELASWILRQSLPDMRLAAVTGYAINDFGSSAVTAVSLTSSPDHGLLLPSPASAVAEVDAPNVTATHVSVGGALIDHFTVAVFNETINLPTTDPNYAAHFHTVVVLFVASGTTKGIEIARYDKPASGTTISVSVSHRDIRLTSSAQTGNKLQFKVYNENYTEAPTPYELTGITLPASGVTAVVGSDSTTDRWGDDSRSVYAPQAVAITTAASYLQNVTILLYDGTKNNWHGWHTIGGSVTLKIGLKGSREIIFAPTTNLTGAIIRVAPGTWEGNDSDGWKNMDTGAGPYAATSIPGIVNSSAYTISKMALPAASTISTLSAASGAGGAFPYNLLYPDGQQGFSVPNVSVNAATAFADINTWIVIFTAQDLDSSGASIGVEHSFMAFTVANDTIYAGPLDGPYGDHADPARSGVVAKVLVKCYTGNRLCQTSNAWQDTTNCVRFQASVTITIATTSPYVPAGAIPGSRVAGAVSNATLAQTATSVPGAGVFGAIDIGGGGAIIPVMSVKNAGGTLIAQFGQFGSNYGLYTQNLWVGNGGPGPLGAKLWIDASGNIQMLGAINSGSSITGASISGGSLSITTTNGTVIITNTDGGVVVRNGALFSQMHAQIITCSNGSQNSVILPNSITSTFLNYATSLSGGPNSTVVLNSSAQFVGAGVACPTFDVNARQYTRGAGQVVVIDSSGQFVGTHVFIPNGNVNCSSLTIGSGGIIVPGGMAFQGQFAIGIKDGFGNNCSLVGNSVNYGAVRLNIINGIFCGLI